VSEANGLNLLLAVLMDFAKIPPLKNIWISIIIFVGTQNSKLIKTLR